jgi:hypothetical protein
MGDKFNSLYFLVLVQVTLPSSKWLATHGTCYVLCQHVLTAFASRSSISRNSWQPRRPKVHSRSSIGICLWRGSVTLKQTGSSFEVPSGIILVIHRYFTCFAYIAPDCSTEYTCQGGRRRLGCCLLNRL